MAATTHLMTVEEFRKLPEDGGARHELRHGEVIALTRPKLKHALIQRKLRRLLEQFAEPESLVDVEVAFRPEPEHELRVADVAYLSAERFRQADPEDNISGAPDLVIEVLSPSNTATEMYDREQMWLANGGRELWVGDPGRRQVRVTSAAGRVVSYGEGGRMPLPLFGTEAGVSVEDIFR